MQPAPVQSAPVQSAPVQLVPVPGLPVSTSASAPSAPDGQAVSEPSLNIKKTRNRQNFTWRQVSVLEQVFETEPLPWPVSHGHTARVAPLAHTRFPYGYETRPKVCPR